MKKDRNTIEVEASRENMLAILYIQDMWKSDFLNKMDNEELLFFGSKNGVWEVPLKNGKSKDYSQEYIGITKALNRLRNRN